MLGYVECDKNISEGLKQYIRSGESCKISGIIECNSRFYRQVIFSKKNFIRTKSEIKGYLFLDNENKAVTNQNLLKDLIKLGYHYEMFFYDEKDAGILVALKTDLDMEKDKEIMEDIKEGLDFLLTKQVNEAERVKSAIIEIYELREKSNSILKELSNIVTNMQQQDLIFNEEVQNKLYPYNEDMLMVNFQKIKCIAGIEDSCDEVRTEAEKKRKTLAARISGNMVGKLIKVSDEISYYKRLITLYASVIHMNNNQYIRYLNDLNKERIENRIGLIRS